MNSKLHIMVVASVLALALFAPPALACSINAAGTCGGSACPAGKTCTKNKEGTACSCEKDKASAKKPKAEKAATPAVPPASKY